MEILLGSILTTQCFCHAKDNTQSLPCRGNKGKSKEETFLVRRGIHGGINLGDNPAGHYFVLRKLVPTSFFK